MDAPSISPELLKILACPACPNRPGLQLTEDQKYLQCTECKRKYPIADGRIPQLVVEEAILEEEE